jgi:hypothetical protein
LSEEAKIEDFWRWFSPRHPRAALDANDRWIRRVGAKHPEESYGQLEAARFFTASVPSVVKIRHLLAIKPVNYRCSFLRVLQALFG